MKNAESTLQDLKDEKSNLWKATKKYYFEYFSVYSLLIKLGIKCEIHDCTIELIKNLEEKELLPKRTHKKIRKDKDVRIENQYYLKDKEVEINHKELLEFYLEIKDKVNSLTKKQINKIRDFISRI